MAHDFPIIFLSMYDLLFVRFKICDSKIKPIASQKLGCEAIFHGTEHFYMPLASSGVGAALSLPLPFTTRTQSCHFKCSLQKSSNRRR
jgi:hypothetical protein